MNNIFYTKEGDGNDVLFLHGWGGNHDSFKILYPFLKEVCATCVDLQGFGNSQDPPPSGWNTEDYADNLAEFVRLQNFKNLTVVGHSFGGRIGVVFAAKYPHLLKKLVLIDAAGLKRASLKRYIAQKRYKKLKKAVLAGKKDKSALDKYGSEDFKTCKAALRPTFVKVINQSLKSFASEIRCPTLLIWGKEDDATPMWIAKKYRKLIKNSGLVVFKDCGHFCYLDNPRGVAAVLNSFFKSGEG